MLAFACSGAEMEEETSLGATQAPIYNGTAITEAGSGVVRMIDPSNFNATFGSGTLLTNQWVLTASHCASVQWDWKFALHASWSTSTDTDSIASVKAPGSTTTVYGGSTTSGGNRVLLLGRLTGTPAAGDTAFDGDGRVVLDIPGSSSEALTAITLQSDGKIVGVGYVTIGGSKQMFIARFKTNGGLDTTFDSNGYAFLAFANFTSAQANSVLIDSAGKILVGGSVSDASHTEFALARYTTAGALDTSFDVDGKLTTSWGASSYVSIRRIGLLSTGKIVAVGTGSNPGFGWAAVARYSSAGALDTSFASTGKVSLGPTNTGQALAIDSLDKVYVGGSESGVATIWRLKTDGSLDTGFFGIGGALKPTFFSGTDNSAVRDLVYAGGGNPIRAIVDLNSSGSHAVGVASFSQAGNFTPDRLYPELTGTQYSLPGSAAPSSGAVFSGRVVIAGTGGNRGHLLSVVPDKTSYVATATTPFPAAIKMGNETRTITEVYSPPGAGDVALVKVSSGFTMANSTSGYSFAGFSAKTEANAPYDVTCKGYGNSTVDPMTGAQGGLGTLRTGNSTVKFYDDYYAVVGFRSAGTQQVPLAGDSGSSCFDSAGKIIGVNSRGGNTESLQVPAAQFANWATATMIAH